MNGGGIIWWLGIILGLILLFCTIAGIDTTVVEDIADYSGITPVEISVDDIVDALSE
ncbi:MAG: hypothetical protein IKE43_08645 [Coriobacteriales bacterium]|nr:hypothetical protein [Coriobacteriales bacterium]